MFQCVGSNPAGSVQAAARLHINEPGKDLILRLFIIFIIFIFFIYFNFEFLFRFFFLFFHYPYFLFPFPHHLFLFLYLKQNNLDKYKHRKQYPSTKSRLTQTIPLPSQISLSQEKNTKILSKNVLDSLLSQVENDDGNSQDPNDSNNDDYDDDYDDDESDQDSEGSIHAFGPGVDPKKLLNSLTNNKQDNHDKQDEISHFSQSPFPTVTRKYPDLDGTKSVKTSLPGPPRDLVAQIVNPRFVALSWMEPLKNPDEVTSYTVYYKMTTSERERKITTKSRDDQLANIQSLLPGRTYQFRVVGNSNNGAGESSTIYEVSTQPEENISGPPQEIDGYPISHKELHVQWTPPLVTNGNISKYRIYYSLDDGSEMFTDSTSHEAVLTELRPFTEYTVSVVPFNQNGMGDPSNELILKTYSATPTEPPTNVTLEATGSTVSFACQFCFFHRFCLSKIFFNLVHNRTLGTSTGRRSERTDNRLQNSLS